MWLILSDSFSLTQRVWQNSVYILKTFPDSSSFKAFMTWFLLSLCQYQILLKFWGSSSIKHELPPLLSHLKLFCQDVFSFFQFIYKITRYNTINSTELLLIMNYWVLFSSWCWPLVFRFLPGLCSLFTPIGDWSLF